MKSTEDRRAVRGAGALALAGLVAGLLAGCSGGGGGGGGTPPTLVSAAFVGPAQPAPGDLLLLFFSEEVRDATGAELTDEDLELSVGGTLGDGSVVIARPTPSSLELRLGTGVSFQPDVTTIRFAPTNTRIADLAGNFGSGGAAVVIGDGDDTAPVIAALTVAAIDPELNGTGPAGGMLQAPQSGWTIDARWSDLGPLLVDPARTRITADVGVVAAGATQPPGTDLLPFLTTVTADTSAASYHVPATTRFPPGAVTLTVVAIDAGGRASAPRSFALLVRAFTDDLQPFETSAQPEQIWWIDTGRDIERYSFSQAGGGVSIDVIDSPNGRADLLDVLYALGLQHDPPLAAGSGDTNTVVTERFRDAILAELALLFDGVNTSFTFTRPPGVFGSASAFRYADFGYSQICLAGSAETPGVLGVAQLDPSNRLQNNDCLLEGQGTSQSRLGVFLHTIADVGLESPPTSSFRVVFDAFAPAFANPPQSGPIGSLPGDGQRVLGQLVNDARQRLLDAAIADLARFAAVILAHECGHSMGLVVNGPMPTGLYGNDVTNFPGSSNGHIATPALFPGGATNVMSPGLQYDSALSPATGFNSLNLAYLREQVFYGN